MKRHIAFLTLMAVILATLLLLASSLGNGVAADPGAVSAANQLYATGHYAEAARIYEQELARGVVDSAIYYNLGNAYFQQGDLGRAVLSLERAAQLDPRDADIQANLQLARQQTTELFAGEQEGPVALLATLSGWLTVNETAVLVLGFWFLLGFLLLARRVLGNGRRGRLLGALAVVALVLLLLFGASLASRSFLAQTQPAGVVVAPSVAVSDGPGPEYSTAYSLPSGTAVNLVATSGQWAQLAVPPGATASWVPLDAVESLAG